MDDWNYRPSTRPGIGVHVYTDGAWAVLQTEAGFVPVAESVHAPFVQFHVGPDGMTVDEAQPMATLDEAVGALQEREKLLVRYPGRKARTQQARTRWEELEAVFRDIQKRRAAMKQGKDPDKDAHAAYRIWWKLDDNLSKLTIELKLTLWPRRLSEISSTL